MNKKKHSPRSADIVVIGTWCRAIDNPNFDLATKTATATTRAETMPTVTS